MHISNKGVPSQHPAKQVPPRLCTPLQPGKPAARLVVTALAPSQAEVHTCHISKAADLMPLLLQVTNLVLIVLERHVLKPGGQRTAEGTGGVVGTQQD